MPCKPGVAGSIPGFSIKPLSVEPSGVPVILINTQIINPLGPVLVSTHGKATKSFNYYIIVAHLISYIRCIHVALSRVNKSNVIRENSSPEGVNNHSKSNFKNDA